MIVVGVDGGATRTRALAYDTASGRAGVGVAGPSNPVNVGVGAAGRSIREAVEEAVASVGAGVGEVAVVYAGLAGVDSELVRREVAPGLREASGLGERLIVDHDAYISLLAATRGEGRAILVIAGTGSIVFTIGRGGERVIVADRGWLLGDEGSGFWTGRLALRRLLQALDGRRRHDCLTRYLASRLQVSSSDELMYWFYKNQSVEKVAGVAKLVGEAAREGCEIAEVLLRRGARLLARAVLTAYSRTGYRRVYITGSMFANKAFLEEFKHTLEQRSLTVVEEKLYPVLGALYAALKTADHPNPAIAFSPQLEKLASRLYVG